jgi:hypothetical protein
MLLDPIQKEIAPWLRNVEQADRRADPAGTQERLRTGDVCNVALTAQRTRKLRRGKTYQDMRRTRRATVSKLKLRLVVCN